MKVLVTGRTGQVGSAICRELKDRVDVVATGRDELDLADLERIPRFICETRPDLIINAAAYTAVDRAEDDPDVALALNARAVHVLGEVAAGRGIAIVHYSTDYVFDGSQATPYTEDDPPAPLSVYGRTKRLGEVALASSGAAYLTLRVGWVYSSRSGNFLTTMLRLMRERERLRVVADEFGAPTWSRDIARATVRVLEAMAGPPEAWTRASLRAALESRGGLYHLSPGGETSWHGFAEEILASAASGPAPLRVRDIIAIPASEWPSTAPRPLNSRLSSERLAAETGLRLPDWTEGVSACIRESADKIDQPAEGNTSNSDELTGSSDWRSPAESRIQ
ncbi:MAG: dTDP-4-dehydrorhamnose reductase [Gemmatimonadota bacterium]|nr:dTDP-4-dehydrorhamnose reductase [Gemmatimonadota bacterium]